MKSITIKWDGQDNKTESMDIHIEGQPTSIELTGVLAIALQSRITEATASDQINNPNAANNLAQTPSE